VIDSRASAEGDLIRRRRACGCGHRFTTYEALSHPAVDLKRWERARNAVLEILTAMAKTEDGWKDPEEDNAPHA
jgi:transcriptional regulator NrdR family protein